MIIKLQREEVFRNTYQQSTVMMFSSVKSVVIRLSGGFIILPTRKLIKLFEIEIKNPVE